MLRLKNISETKKTTSKETKQSSSAQINSILKTNNQDKENVEPKKQTNTPLKKKIQDDKEKGGIPSNKRINTLLERKKQDKENADPKKKKKRKRNSDGPWRGDKKYKKSANEGNVLAMRTHNTTMVKIDDKEQPLKLSVIANDKVMPPAAFELFNKKLHEIECYTPMKKILEQSLTVTGSPGSPIKIQSETAILKRIANYNCFYIFSNESKLPALNPTHPTATQSEIDYDHPFFQSTEYVKIKKFNNSIKEQTITVDPVVLQNSASERRKDNYTRKTQQNSLMAESGKTCDGSATKYANAMELFLPNVSWNWAHLISHSLGASASQTSLNLVAATEFANTDMIFIESQLSFLAKAYPQGFTLHVKANLMRREPRKENEYLQIATTIEYTITTPHFPLPLVFNAQSTEKPHILFAKVFSAFVKTMVEHHKKIAMDKALKDKDLSDSPTQAQKESSKKPHRKVR